jgi:hypothetical protein
MLDMKTIGVLFWPKNMESLVGVENQGGPEGKPVEAKNPNSLVIVVAIILTILIGVGTTFAVGKFLFNKKIPSSTEVAPNQLEVNKELREKVFPVVVYGPILETESSTVPGGPAECQPEFFDPKISKFYKVKQTGVPSELYKVDGFMDNQADGVMMINGWYKEGEDKINLPAPFSATIYKFGCASSFSSVIDLKRNGVRQGLYTHVLSFAFSDDGKRLFLVNNTKDQGNWTLHKRIIDLQSKQIKELPNARCLAGMDGMWQGDRLITYSQNLAEENYQTDVCVWDETAKLISRIGTTSAWGAANRSFLAEKIGLLPRNPNVFYAYTSKDENMCALVLADMVNKTTKLIDVLDKHAYSEAYYCASPGVEFDLKGVEFDGGKIKYRIENETEWMTAPVMTNIEQQAIEVVKQIAETRRIESAVIKAGRKPFYTIDGTSGRMVSISLRESVEEDARSNRIETFMVNMDSGVITIEDVVSGGQISLEDWKVKVNQSWGF